MNRKNFVLRDFQSRKIIKDPKLSKLTQMMHSAAITSIRNFSNLYDENELNDDDSGYVFDKKWKHRKQCIEILSFDRSFVSYMAERTYVSSVQEESIIEDPISEQSEVISEKN